MRYNWFRYGPSLSLTSFNSKRKKPCTSDCTFFWKIIYDDNFRENCRKKFFWGKKQLQVYFRDFAIDSNLSISSCYRSLMKFSLHDMSLKSHRYKCLVWWYCQMGKGTSCQQFNAFNRLLVYWCTMVIIMG